MAKRLLLASMAAGALTAACASAPTRNYVVRGPDTHYVQAQVTSAREWMAQRGVFDEVSYGADTVSFKYGSDEPLTMDYGAFEAFVTSRLAGHTTANLQRANITSSSSAVPTTILYYGPDGRFAQWRGNRVQQGRWWIEAVPESEKAKVRSLGAIPPERVICFQAETASGKPSGLPSCSGAYEQLVAVHGKHAGDVFNLLSGEAPGALSSDFPKVWPDGQQIFPEKAPHD